MNRWALALQQAPATLQRLIARHNRISLPRRCSPSERLQRLRVALIHQRTVRVTYFSLDAATHAALQDLRQHRAGIATAVLAQRYGPIRSLSALAADRRPRTISERLLLLGWLLPRRTGTAGYRLVSEVAAWLPRPLALPTAGPAVPPPVVPAVHAMSVLLVAAQTQPLAVRADGLLRHESLRQLIPRLSPAAAADAAALYAWLLPLLYQLDLIERHAGRIVPTVAAHRMLSRPLAAQQQRLQQTWIGSASPDRWLGRPMGRTPSDRGIDWPVFRRRLCLWAAALPTQQWVAWDGLHDALAAALGPLADAHTHGYRRVDRVPWQPHRAAAIWEAALRGPVAWLGLVTWRDADPHTGGGGAQVARVAAVDTTAPVDLPADSVLPSEADAASGADHADAVAAAWRYGDPGDLLLPHTALPAATLRLLPFADWWATDSTCSHYRVTPSTLARAARQGWSDTVFWQLLAHQAGPPPDVWRAGLAGTRSRMQIRLTGIVIADDPTVLTRAATNRSVTRCLETRVAPGIALVPPEQIDRLQRTLARQDVIVEQTTDQAAPPPRIPGGQPLSAAACAALLTACAFYRQHAPPGAPPVPPRDLDERLRAGLTPALRQAVDATLLDLPAPAGPTAHAVAADLRGAAHQVQLAEAQRATAERRAQEWERRARQAEARVQELQPVAAPTPPMPADDFWAGLADVLGPRPPTPADPTPAPPRADHAVADQATLPSAVSGGGDAPGTRHADAPGACPRDTPVTAMRIATSAAPACTVAAPLTPPIPHPGATHRSPPVAPHAHAETAPVPVVARVPATSVPALAPLLVIGVALLTGCRLGGWRVPPGEAAPDTAGDAVCPREQVGVGLPARWEGTDTHGFPQPDAPAPITPALPATLPTLVDADLLGRLRHAMAHRRTLDVVYDTGGRGQPEARLIRPLHLEAHGPLWYLRAYCVRARAERTFRVDRVHALTVVGGRPRRGDPEARQWHREPASVALPVARPPRDPPPRRATDDPVRPPRAPGTPRIWLDDG